MNKLKTVSKKQLGIITILVVICISIVVTIFFWNNKNQGLKLKNDSVTFEYGEKVVLHYDLLENENSMDIWKDVVVEDNFEYETIEENEVVKLGEYKVELTYKSKVTDLSVIIQDTVAPEFVDFQESIEIPRDSNSEKVLENYNAKDLAEVDISLDDKEVNYQEAGTYSAKVVAKDTSENSTEKEIEIIIKDKNEEEIKEEEEVKNQETKTGSQAGTGGSTGNNSGQGQQPSAPVETTRDPVYRRDISNSYVSKINSYRQANGLSPYPVTGEAQAEADMRAMQLVSNYGHNASYGYGENIGMGDLGYDFFEAWKQSPGHNREFLEESMNVAFAVSAVEYNNKLYIVVSFKSKY